ncbi:DUF4974 domain-containing protein [Puteibacter caeruleilacunae]|nr:DUF4974 domain-containing protein [Puteibacter caeruleilacunae]
MEQKKLIHYIKGRLSDDERQQVHKWLKESEENKKELIRLKNVWSLSSYQKKIESDKTLKAWEHLNKEMGSKAKVRRLTPGHVLQYAASVIAIFALGALFQYYIIGKQFETVGLADLYTTVEAPFGQTAKATLPDGTEVYLNSGTTIKYANQFIGDERRVEISGEAYFDVASDKERFFIVDANDLQMKVYGTEFNVHAYPDEKIMHTTLIEGSLGLESTSGNELVRLKPGQDAAFDKESRRLNVKNVNLDLYTSWKDGVITFRNESLKTIVTIMERWYDVEVIFNDKNLGDEVYSGTILKNRSATDMFDIMGVVVGFKYELQTKFNEQDRIYLTRIKR